MKTYLYMIIMAAVMAAFASVSMADSVNIGLGSMDRAEWNALKQVMHGDRQVSTSVSISSDGDRIRVGEFSQSEVDAFRQAMTADASTINTTSVSVRSDMVDIGTGSMQTDEFCNLNKLVANNGRGAASGFAFICP